MQLQMHSIVELLCLFPFLYLYQQQAELKEAAKIVKDYNSH